MPASRIRSFTPLSAPAAAAQETADAAAAAVVTAQAVADDAAAGVETITFWAANHLLIPFVIAVDGLWGPGVDGARVNGGGLVGVGTATPLIALTEMADNQAFTEDANGVTKRLSAAGAGFGQAYDCFPTVLEAGDRFIFGANGVFAEVAFDLSVLATYTASVLTPKYWNGAWTPISNVQLWDNTNNATRTGARALLRTGAITFYPPADWALSNQGPVGQQQNGYYMCLEATSNFAQMTQKPRMNNKRPEIVTATAVAASPAPVAGTVVTVEASSNETTMGNTADTKFFIFNQSRGTRTALLTWTKSNRRQVFTGLSMYCGRQDQLVVYCVQSDGTANERSGVKLVCHIQSEAPGA